MYKFVRKTFICIIVTSLLLFSGCSGCEIIDDILQSLSSGYSVYFADSDITMTKGDKITIDSDDLIFQDLAEGRDASDISFSLSTSDSAVVKVSGKTIQAQSTGRATITLVTEDGEKGYLRVTVESAVQSVEFAFPFGRFLPCSSDYSVDVYAVVNGGTASASEYKIAWYVNGKAISNYSGNPLTLYNSGSPAVSEVKAVVYNDGKSFSVSDCVGYYAGGLTAVEKPVISADKTVFSTGETVKLSLREEFDYAEWYISGEYCGEGSTVEFTPDKAGYYEVYSDCAGYRSNVLELTVCGDVTAENVEASYNETYPVLTVTWQGTNGVDCLVTAKTDKESVSVNSSTGSASLNVNPEKAYTVTVTAAKSADFFSSTAQSVNVSAVTEQEKYYLGMKYYDGDYYIANDVEFYEFFDYMMYFRKQPVGGKTTVSTERVYMAYDYGDYDDLLGRAFDYSTITGSYNLRGAADGKTATVVIEFFTVNTPSVKSVYAQEYHYDALDALPFDWNAGGEKVKYFSAAEKGKVKVSTTDQMFRVAEKGYVPVPEIGSSAANVYSFAEQVLDDIVSEDMTDMERARAIYEYIMYKNTYDGSVVEYDIEKSVKSASFYMESILIEEDSYGVCDAMSKTFSFLCNMANVKAVRVTGYAGSGSQKGGHAWNKVSIDGNWYIVDCTWGDANVPVRKKSGFSYKGIRLESASHTYFLLTDADVASTHVAGNDEGPATSTVPYCYYARAEENGSSPSLYIQSEGAKLVEDLENIAQYIVDNASESRKIVAYGIDRVSNYYGIEFSVCRRSLEAADKIMTGKTRSSFYTKLTRAGLTYNVVCDDDTYFVIVNKGSLLYNSVPNSNETPSRPYWWPSF